MKNLRERCVSLFIVLGTICFGCGRAKEEAMEKPFRPASLTNLADIDVANVEYEQEPVEIEGLVSPSGQGGWPGRNDDYKVHSFTLAAWRIGSGPIVESKLLILRSLPRDVEDYFSDFPKYSFQRFRLLLSVDHDRAVFVQRLPSGPPDDHFASIAEKLREPVVMTTQQFGDLTLDPRIEWYEGEKAWNGDVVRISFEPDAQGSIETPLRSAAVIWSDQAGWKERVNGRVLVELLELKNGTWLEEGESPLTGDEFLSQMTLESISFDRDGEIEFWFDDGDLFWGHSISVKATIAHGPTHAGISG